MLKLWKCGLYFGSDVLQLLLRDFFIILSWFLAGFCSVLKNVPGIQRPFGQLPSRIRKLNTLKCDFILTQTFEVDVSFSYFKFLTKINSKMRQK